MYNKTVGYSWITTPVDFFTIIIFSFFTEYSYIFLYEGASYSVNYNDSIVVRFAHNNEHSYSNPESIQYNFYVIMGFYDFPPFQYVIRSGRVPYTGEIYINNIQFSHNGEYRIHHHHHPHHWRSRVEHETFVITVNSESAIL